MLCSVHQRKGIGILCNSSNTKTCLLCCVESQQVFDEYGGSTLSLEELKERLIVKNDRVHSETQTDCALPVGFQNNAADADTETANVTENWLRWKFQKATQAPATCFRHVIQEVSSFLQNQVDRVFQHEERLELLKLVGCLIALLISIFTCLHIAGYNQCSSSPCTNGGTCTINGDTFECICPDSFTGKTCEIQISYCDSYPCQNGATCLNTPGSFTCTCATGYVGNTCETGCPDGWKHFEGHCYIFDSQRTSWLDALNICGSKDAELVDIHDSAENSFVKANILNTAWIGLNDRRAEGKFVWSNGKAGDYRYWNVHEPNGGSSEDCVTMLSSGRWNDELCLRRLPYVCKMHLEEVYPWDHSLFCLFILVHMECLSFVHGISCRAETDAVKSLDDYN